MHILNTISEHLTVSIQAAKDAWVEIPPFTNIINSFLYVSTYRKPVDLSAVTIEKLNAITGEEVWNSQATAKVLKLFENESTKEVFSGNPTSKLDNINTSLKKLGYKILAEKNIDGTPTPYYGVVQTPDSSLILKYAPNHHSPLRQPPEISFPSDNFFAFAFGDPNESLLRIKMASLIKVAATENKLNITVPKKIAIKIPRNSRSSRAQYVIAAEAIDLLSIDEMKIAITEAPKKEQEELALRVHRFIELTGFVDVNIGNNILFRRGDERPLSTRELVVIDTEPRGSLETKDKKSLFPSSCLEKCRVIGGLQAYAFSIQNFGKETHLTKALLTLARRQTRQRTWMSTVGISSCIFFPLILTGALKANKFSDKRKRVLLTVISYLFILYIAPIVKALHIAITAYNMTHAKKRLITCFENTTPNDSRTLILQKKYIKAKAAYHHAINNSFLRLGA
ncbi:MAG: hypothetical protein SP1CHLAM9_02050 [Chlamydiia bacterium]|nr:hypothetical protein [Chlamydiia bacterium]MCH9624654.1 hypothetical protein [Chlamydiia bacterium]